MIKSMTGFGRADNNDGYRQFTVEIKAVNHRYNDIVIKKPKHLNYLEEKIRKFIKSKIKRGRIEVYIHLENIKDNEVYVKPDINLAKSYKSALQTLCEELKLDNNISIDMFMRFPDILNIEKKEDVEDEVWECLKGALEISLEKLQEMRIKEGEQLAKDINDRALLVEEYLKTIESRTTSVMLEYKEKLKNRVNELLDGKIVLDENKLENEVVFYADKSNITEEIVRLYSHIKQLSSTIKSGESVGRKLDFLVQEMNREVNTIGSKAGDIHITNNVLNIKSELEKIREQIQNIE